MMTLWMIFFGGFWLFVALCWVFNVRVNTHANPRSTIRFREWLCPIRGDPDKFERRLREDELFE